MAHSPALTHNMLMLMAAALSGCNAAGNADHVDNSAQDSAMDQRDAQMDVKPILAMITGAEDAQKAGNLAKADSMLDEAIAAMGNSYASAKDIDDTGMKLTLSAAERKQGNDARALALKMAVAKSRAAMLAQKLGVK